MKENGIEVFELAGVEPNPRHSTANKGAAICKKENIDVILAVGGGSTIDCAKGVARLPLQKMGMYGRWYPVAHGSWRHFL